MVHLPQGEFVDHIFLKAQCLARILQHVGSVNLKQPVTYVTPKIFDNLHKL